MNSRTRGYYANETEERGKILIAPGLVSPSGWGEVGGHHLERLLRRTVAVEVYLALHRGTRTHRELMLVERLPGVDQPALRRAVEADAFAADVLRHPGIARIEDVGIMRDGRLYVATARPVGRALGEILDELRALPLRRVLELGLRIVDAVAAAHDAGVAHGWLTPDSVVVAQPQPGQPERVVVLGFGTATAQDGAPVPATGSRARDPFASPERAAGGPASQRDDVFALGSVLLNMFTGEVPLRMSATASGSAAAAVDPDPRTLAEAVGRARSADPLRRYASAAHLAAALRAISDPYPERASVGLSLAAGAATLDAPARELRDRVLPPPTVAVAAGSGRARRATVGAAGIAAAFASAFVVGWAARAWQQRSASDLPESKVAVARPPAPAAPPVVAEMPVPAPSGRAVPPPEPAPESAAPATTVPARAPEVAASPLPTRLAPVENSPIASAARPAPPASDAVPVGRSRPTDVTRVASTAARGTDSVNRRAAGAGPRPAPALSVSTANVSTANAPAANAPAANVPAPAAPTARVPAGVTASAAGEVAAPGRPDASAVPVGGAVATADVVSSAAGVRAAVAEYANAIEARDLGWLRRVYPGMTESQRQAWAVFFGSVGELRTRFVVRELTAVGETAQVQVRGTYEYQNLRPHRTERSPVSFTATLTREGPGWRVRTVE